MNGLLRQSGTIVFVSHNLASVAEFCDRVLWLQAGSVASLGAASESVDAYRDWVASQKSIGSFR
jgi:ABC-type polysaccharide/polyol phosphate transport system ATPase subunit